MEDAGLGSALSQLAPVLDAIDIAVEPDRRYGVVTATLESPICVFKAKGGAPIEAERPEYRIMRTITEISLLAAAAVSDERDVLFADIRASSGLNGSERLRLLALCNQSQPCPYGDHGYGEHSNRLSALE